MGVLVDLTAWREEREPEARLVRAVEGLDAVLAGRDGEAPGWLVTELYAALGCRSLGLVDEAVRRIERAAARLGKELRRAERQRRRAEAVRRARPQAAGGSER